MFQSFSPLIRRFFPILLLLLALGLTLSLSACGDDEAEDYIFAYDLPSKVTSLDPQFATSDASKLVIYNTFEGLLTKDSSGEVENGVATGYTVSPDQLTYTFSLRGDAKWSSGDPVTPQDFVFAFERLFDPQTPSPYAQELLCLKNAQAILGGILPSDQLGVRASGSNTLVIELEYPNADLPNLLCESYSMPCNQTFFLEQKGRYGLDQRTTLFNGPFVLKKLDNATSINLRQNEKYVSEKPVIAAGANLYVGRENPTEEFLKGNADVAKVQGADLEEIAKMGGSTVGMRDTVWSLLFSQNDPQLQNEQIRSALVRSVDPTLVEDKLTGDAQPTGDLIPPTVRLYDQNYRDLVGDLPPLPADALPLRELFGEGLSALQQTKLQKIDLLVLDAKMDRNVAGALQQCWQKELNAYINVRPLAYKDLLAAYQTGKYQMILLPFSSGDGRPSSILEDFVSDSSSNTCGLQNPVFDALIEAASQANDTEKAGADYWKAEILLQQSCTILPLYTTASYYALAPGVEGIRFISPQGGPLFKYAQKK